jgi:hypothetical protein
MSRTKTFAFAGLLTLSALLVSPNAVRGDASTGEKTLNYVRVEGVAVDQLSIDVQVGPPENCKQLHFVVRDTIINTSSNRRIQS